MSSQDSNINTKMIMYLRWSVGLAQLQYSDD